MITLRWDCHWVQRRLPLLAGGDLSVAERRRAERHLSFCAACRRLRASWSDALEPLHRAASDLSPNPEPGPSLWPEIRRQLLAPGPTSAQAITPSALVQWMPVGALAAACALLIFVGMTQPVGPISGRAGTPDHFVVTSAQGPIRAPEFVTRSDVRGQGSAHGRASFRGAPMHPRVQTVGFDLSYGYITPSETADRSWVDGR